MDWLDVALLVHNDAQMQHIDRTAFSDCCFEVPDVFAFINLHLQAIQCNPVMITASDYSNRQRE